MAAGTALVRDKVSGRNTHTESLGTTAETFIQILKSQINTSLGECFFLFVFFLPFFHLIAFSRPLPMVIIHCSLSLL